MKDVKVDLNTGTLFLELLFLLFLGLKLADKIDWSWWWVFSPLWIPVALVIAFFGIAFLVMAISIPFRGKNVKKSKK
jgi:hypothetical protein